VPHGMNSYRQLSLMLLLVGGLLTPCYAAADRQLTPHVAEYKVKVSVLSGKLRTEVRLSDKG